MWIEERFNKLTSSAYKIKYHFGYGMTIHCIFGMANTKGENYGMHTIKQVHSTRVGVPYKVRVPVQVPHGFSIT